MTVGVTVDMDVGGTFADGFFSYGDQSTGVKVDTTPHDLTLCFWACLEAGAGALGFADLRSMLARTSVIRFATTIGTNAILQGTGPRLGVLVSAGQHRRLYADSDASPLLGRFVPPELVMPVGLDAMGEPDHAAVRDALKAMLGGGARHVVIALRGAGRDDGAEQRVAAVVRRSFPTHYLGSVPLLLSSAARPRLDDFSRTNVAVLNAYLHRDLASALYRAEDRLRDEGYGRPLLVTQSSGGAARVAKTRAIDTYDSGPVAGLFGCAEFARRYFMRRAVTVDVGGTSTDIGLIEDGEPRYGFESRIAGIPVDLPSFEIHSIAGGGGSILRPRDGGGVSVGPDSAGAVPGPVAYGLGGTQPTVTDAYLVLGYLDPAYFLGGRRKLDIRAAESALRVQIADPLGIAVEDAALAAVAELVHLIADGVTKDTQPDGVAGAALFAFGGGGGLLAAALGDALGIDAWLFDHGAVLNAFGSSQMDVMHTYERSLDIPLDDRAVAPLSALLAELELRGARDMRGEGFTSEPIAYLLELEVRPPEGPARLVQVPHTGDRRATVCGGIEAAGTGARLVCFRVRAAVAVPHARIAERAKSDRKVETARRAGRRIVLPVGPVEASVYDRRALAPGHIVLGPALVEAADTTILVPAGRRLIVDRFGNATIPSNPPGTAAA